jgi:hypothetical protein
LVQLFPKHLRPDSASLCSLCHFLSPLPPFASTLPFAAPRSPCRPTSVPVQPLAEVGRDPDV